MTYYKTFNMKDEVCKGASSFFELKMFQYAFNTVK